MSTDFNPPPAYDSLSASYRRSSTVERQSLHSIPLTVPKKDPHTHETGFSYVKIIFVILLFLLSLVSFVVQTETTSYVYSIGFNEPVLLLLLTHGSWWMLWPIQFIANGSYKTVRRYIRYKRGYEEINDPKKWKGWRRSFASSVKAQHKNIFQIAELTAEANLPDFTYQYGGTHSFRRYTQFFKSRAIRYMWLSTLILCVVLNVAGSTWYISMGLSTPSDVTAIYNSSAFTAYVFAIPILHEKFSWIKVSAVLTAVAGVFIVAYSGKDDDAAEYPHRLLGNIIILIGAILYGLYEVVYKKKCCPPSSEVSARRQASFSNFSMCLIGINTFLILCVPAFFIHIFGIYKFDIPSDGTIWLYVIISLLGNIIFSVSFLALMSLTSPVLSSVASLVTILVVGVADYILWGAESNFMQIIGYAFVMGGFGLLTYASWNEIAEEDKDDQAIETDTESIISNASNASNSGTI
ncbi:unnamed protein product [Ambrosiozyma monospora]|uniref:Unnamed protein product n=1 Tax=Ambrosiozyma monospora TaxID=43982 RepID=A0ACB5SSV1_AMBMO|nr:unnamed protein product [Ambrosiozyma monospora]